MIVLAFLGHALQDFIGSHRRLLAIILLGTMASDSLDFGRVLPPIPNPCLTGYNYTPAQCLHLFR